MMKPRRWMSTINNTLTRRIHKPQDKARIPLLDIATYYDDRDVFVEQLRHACHTVGFFLIRHDTSTIVDNTTTISAAAEDDHEAGRRDDHISSSTSSSSMLSQRMLDETRRFFEHPLKDKMTISYQDSPSFRGYMPIGVENTAGSVDNREQIEYAVEYNNIKDTDSDSVASSWPDYYNRLKASRNPWPSRIQPTLEPTTKQFTSHVCHIADCIRDAMSLALKVDPLVLKSTFEGNAGKDEGEDEVPHWVIKLISYPPAVAPATTTTTTATTTTSNEKQEADEDSDTQQKSSQQQQQQGVGAHTDTNFLTLLLQDEVGGLQAFSSSQGEEWIDVCSSSTTTTNTDVLVCNLGEQAEIWSRGYFRATPHRVLMNSCQKKSRVSVPLFYNPTLSSTIEPIDETQLSKLVWDRDDKDDGHREAENSSDDESKEAATATPTSSRKDNNFWRRPNNSMLSSVGENTFKSLARSHPVVFKKHHPDLQLLEDGRIIQR